MGGARLADLHMLVLEFLNKKCYVQFVEKPKGTGVSLKIVIILILVLMLLGCESTTKKVGEFREEAEFQRCIEKAIDLVPEEIVLKPSSEVDYSQIYGTVNSQLVSEKALAINSWELEDSSWRDDTGMASSSILYDIDEVFYSRGSEIGQNKNALYPNIDYSMQYSSRMENDHDFGLEYASEKIISEEGLILGRNSFTIMFPVAEEFTYFWVDAKGNCNDNPNCIEKTYEPRIEFTFHPSFLECNWVN